MVLVSHRHKFIYIKNAKVAGTSIEAYFEPYCLDPDVPYEVTESRETSVTNHGIVASRGMGHGASKTCHAHLSAAELRGLVPAVFDSYFKFAVVRNPFDMMVSRYYFRRQRDPTNDISFREYCLAWNEDDNYNRISISGRPAMNYIMRYEHLQEDLETVCKHLGIPYNPERLPSFKSQYRPANDDYRKHYDRETRAHVERVFARELKAFGYSF